MWTVLVYALTVAVLFSLFYYRKQVLQFWHEVRGELLKCSWPWNPELSGLRRYKELIDSTVVVSVVTLILGAYVAMFDFLITHLVGWMVRF